jgi:hypothetical protein
MPTTSNFGWTTPADTDLVKDGAAAIRTLGNGIDTSFLDLKGGTTGQVLTKASNTDLDFSWVADATGIPATIFDAKGDIIAATAADSASRLAVGTNGQYLTADSTTATGLKWSTASSGAVLAVKQAFKSDSYTTTSTTFGDITGLSVTYTPTSASNKILLIAHIFGMGTIGSSGIQFVFSRGGTAIGQADASGSLTRTTGATQAADGNNGVMSAFMYLDSPATTNSTTWTVQSRVDAGTGYVNRTSTDGYVRGTSSLTIMEVTP